MALPMWMVELIKKGFPKRFDLARATRIGVVGRAVDRLLFEGDDIVFLPRDNVINVGRPIERQENIVLPSKVVEHFVEQAEYLWINHKCICRDADSCTDYPIELGCLFMGQAVTGINPALGRMVSRDEAHEHLRGCREAGLVHMIGRNKLDSAWLGVGPLDKLLTVCNCCPCCCLWRVIPDITDLISDKVRRLPGVEVKVNEQCTGCGECSEGECFVNAIRLVDGSAVISDECRGCGRCAQVCPSDAIEIVIEDERYIEDTIKRIAGLVDVK